MSNAQEHLDEVYRAASPQELQTAYQKWAASYDQDLRQLGWDKPQLIVETVMAHCPPCEAVEFGVGTGQVGKCLKEAGFDRLTGLDFSPAMLEQAKRTQAYQRLLVADLQKPLELPSQSFDLALAVGIFTEGHLGAECLPEMLRLLRPGGLFAFSLRNDLEDRLGFRKAFQQMEKTRSWHLRQHRVFNQGLGGHPWSAWLFEIT